MSMANIKLWLRGFRLRNSLFIGGLLAVVGGFLDAYTFILRGGVFANAQTGNMVLFSIRLFDGEIKQAIFSFVPILVFALGVAFACLIKSLCDKFGIGNKLLVLLFEAVILFLVGLIPASADNIFSVTIISFVCAVQVQSFRSLEGSPYATTMCTGNLRSQAENAYCYFQTRDRLYLKKSLKYITIILFFCIGAVVGTFFSQLLGEKSIWICSLILIFSSLIAVGTSQNF